MSVNGITSTPSTYDPYQVTKPSTKPAEETGAASGSTSTKDESGVVYEPSKENTTAPAQKYTQNTELVNKLKADAESHTKQLQNIVQQLMTKQGQTFNNANDMWRFLASGKFEVDEATKLQAQKDIAEDGYWGVNQTSDRIIDFAKALTGGDPSKIEDMRDAFKKGYEQAEKTWGGKLPDISKQTYDAVMEKFDKMAEEAAQNTVPSDTTN
ncbi:MAG: hypothetical protein HFI62_06730 [Lachnospiraceae bacterium]|jgi:hypothetical protein|nr:hypothetical protein [Lachnospiraceae bacterium]